MHVYIYKSNLRFKLVNGFKIEPYYHNKHKVQLIKVNCSQTTNQFNTFSKLRDVSHMSDDNMPWSFTTAPCQTIPRWFYDEHRPSQVHDPIRTLPLPPPVFL